MYNVWVHVYKEGTICLVCEFLNHEAGTKRKEQILSKVKKEKKKKKKQVYTRNTSPSLVCVSDKHMFIYILSAIQLSAKVCTPHHFYNRIETQPETDPNRKKLVLWGSSQTWDRNKTHYWKEKQAKIHPEIWQRLNGYTEMPTLMTSIQTHERVSLCQ